MDHKQKFFLFKQSKNFCAVPWNHVKIDVDGEVRTCVKGTTVLGNINHDSIETILKSPQLAKIRQTLAKDLPAANCEKCRALDNQNQHGSYRYLRDMYNDLFVKSTVDYTNPEDFELTGIDLHWSSTCNLKCVTCWARQSSAIAQELKIPIQNVSVDQADLMVDWIVQNQHNLREIYLSGGEPTLIKHNLRLLEQLAPRSDLLLRVNTNMTFDRNNRVIQQLLRFPSVLITASADATHDQFEYIRQGATWRQFVENLDWLTQTHFQWRINSVFFVASAQRLLHTQNFFRQQYGFTDFTINQCGMEQHSLMARNLPDLVKQHTRNQFLQEIESRSADRNLVGQLENCIAELAQPANAVDYREYFDSIDQRRGTLWRNAFPELA
jgi:radical SAM protein with 4Fe4S-binding SPASM domain